MANHEPNTECLVKYKKQESDTKKQAVLEALRKLSDLNDPLNNPITKAEICRRAGVSKTFLYSYKDELLKPINEAIRKQNVVLKEVIAQKKTFSESSKDKVIDSLKRRILALEEDNKKLKHQNSILLGKLAKR